MPIIIFYRNGQHEVFQSRDTRGLLDFRRIQLTTGEGHETYVYPEDVRRVEYYPDEDWKKMVEAQEKKRAEADEAQAAAEAKRRADEDAKATRALLESRTLKGRIRAFFHIGKKA